MVFGGAITLRGVIGAESGDILGGPGGLLGSFGGPPWEPPGGFLVASWGSLGSWGLPGASWGLLGLRVTAGGKCIYTSAGRKFPSEFGLFIIIPCGIITVPG